ncbi:MAG TPA: aspartate 1-decarboxylase [Acidimicrobiales bacterium]|jgi:aspartate 1-decarboxylase|nr:aspartate 1-decarboxylase [Acidimicrobiales bacterium]
MVGQSNTGNPIRLRRMLKSKIHRIAVTETELGYEGSITIDETLLADADLYNYEQVDVVNINTGGRFSTYVIPGAPGACCLNGAAARLGERGDVLIVMSFDMIDEESARDWKPIVVLGDHRQGGAGRH